MATQLQPKTKMSALSLDAWKPLRMNPAIFKNNPFRQPQWRADSVLQLVEHRPSPLKPRHYDDTYVRTYRRILLSLLVAGDNEAERNAVILDRPHVYQAHTIYFHPDRRLRQIIEARLLTNESLGEIAKRFATDSLTIEFYEKLFFNIRDRMQHKDWIAKIIVGPSEYLAPNQRGSVTEEQQGFIYRLFAHHGGPLVLDALVGGIVPSQMPGQAEDVPRWFDDALGQLVRSRATEAAKVLEVNKHNVMQLMKLALRRSRSATATKSRLAKSVTEQPERLKKIIAAVEKGPLGQKSTQCESPGKIQAASAVDPHSHNKLPVKASGPSVKPQPECNVVPRSKSSPKTPSATHAAPNPTQLIARSNHGLKSSYESIPAWPFDPPIAAPQVAAEAITD